MKQFGLNETKLFHFYGIFKNKNQIKSAKRPPFIHMNPLSINTGPAPVTAVKIRIACTYIDRWYCQQHTTNQEAH